jgi:uncharacterized protein (TIGR00290 family)
MDEPSGTPVFCSWSGGKDSALALHETAAAGARPALLLSMLTDDGERSRAHGLHRTVLEAQADALGLPIRFGAATWQGYEAAFRELLAEAVRGGVTTGVFGDIDLDEHRAWVERVCSVEGVTPLLPLWQRGRRAVVDRLIRLGFRAVIVAVQEQIGPDILGRVLDAELVAEMEEAGIDVAGEQGEFHTLVVDGPGFRRPLEIELGQRVRRDGMWFVDVAAAAAQA